MVNQVSHPTALPLLFFHMRSRCHVGRWWNNDVGWQWHATAMTWYSHHRPQWWCRKLSDLATAIAMSIDMCITFARYRFVCDPWMYPSWVFNPWNPMYTLTCTRRLPWPMLRVQVSGGYGYRSSWSVVFESPVRSGLLVPSALDHNCNQSSQFQALPKTGPNRNRPVFCSLLRLQDQLKPVMVLTGSWLVLTGLNQHLAVKEMNFNSIYYNK